MMKVIQTGWAGWEICNQVFVGFGSELGLAMPDLRPPRYCCFHTNCNHILPFHLDHLSIKALAERNIPQPSLSNPVLPSQRKSYHSHTP